MEMSMEKQLLIVEDRFQLEGRGLVLVPSVPPEMYKLKQNGTTICVILELPDGSTQQTKAKLFSECLYPQGIKTMCYLQSTDKKDVPKGTKVWLLDES